MPVSDASSLFPADFLSLIRQSLPDEASLAQFIAYSQQPLRRSIRVNTLKISVADFLSQTAGYDWQLTPVPWCEEGFWISREDE
ncbi:16S rRNA (cytosine(1407)-C(5))-methyltransferase RsmF, partial [Pantoea agglomerans]|nr:16S rRNA (cytosine(1407)-C(5))-methyltransferase RsmF [Pantoea agglomerans]